jgi:hypothetical protein
VNPAWLPTVRLAEQVISELDELCDQVSQAMLVCLEAKTFTELEIINLVNKLQAVEIYKLQKQLEILQLKSQEQVSVQDWPDQLVATSLANFATAFSSELDMLSTDISELLQLLRPKDPADGKVREFMSLTDVQAAQAFDFIEHQKLLWARREPRLLQDAGNSENFLQNAIEEFAKHESKTVLAALAEFETLLGRVYVAQEQKENPRNVAAQVETWIRLFDQLTTKLDLSPAFVALKQPLEQSFARQRAHLEALAQGQMSKFEFNASPLGLQVNKPWYSEIYARLEKKHPTSAREIQTLRKMREVVDAAFTFETKEEWLAALEPSLKIAIHIDWIVRLAEYQRQAAELVAKERKLSGDDDAESLDQLVHAALVNEAKLSVVLFRVQPRPHFYLVDIFADEIRIAFDLVRGPLRTRLIAAAYTLMVTANGLIASDE